MSDTQSNCSWNRRPALARPNRQESANLGLCSLYLFDLLPAINERILSKFAAMLEMGEINAA
jgi:hypothetical protein